ncbi:MAG: hypothetical protein ACR2NQ_03040 [Thermodesulfobacteriota bacterium]
MPSAPEIDAETEMALSVVDSGCFALPGNSRAIFAVKDGALATLRSGDFQPSIRFHFEHIDGDEFPSVCAVIHVETDAGKFRYEYFFSLDSEKDTQLLDNFSKSSDVEIWFLDSSGGAVAGFEGEFSAEEKAALDKSRRSAAEITGR